MFLLYSRLKDKVAIWGKLTIVSSEMSTGQHFLVTLMTELTFLNDVKISQD